MAKEEKKILIIEDDYYLRDLMARQLLIEGFKVVGAEDGETGLEKAASEKPDLILLDLILPGIDGYEVLEKLKSNPELSKITVVIVSNLAQKSDIEKGLKMGAAEYLVKFDHTPEEVAKKVKKIIK